MSSYNVRIIAKMEGVGPIGPNDVAFLVVKRNDKDGVTMSREQYPAISVVQTPVDENGMVAAGSSNEIRIAASVDRVEDGGQHGQD